MDINEITFIGYHGTSAEICKKIIKNGFIKSHAGWCGAGVYFYEDDEEMSMQWARYKYPKKRVTSIKCNITISKDKMLDVSNPKSENSKKVQQLRSELFYRGLQDGKVIDLRDEEIDCKILNLICVKDNYDLVRNFTYTYMEYDRVYKKRSNICNGVELCVRNCECIDIEK